MSKGPLLLGGLFVGGVLLWASRSTGQVTAVPAVVPPVPLMLPKAKFRAGDTVTVTGGPKGSTDTFLVNAATWLPTGWHYTLSNGSTVAQGVLHLVEPAKV